LERADVKTSEVATSVSPKQRYPEYFGDANYGGYDGWVGGPSTPPENVCGGDNAHFGVPATIVGPMRTYKIGLRYDF
jgi:hypothetical protein